VKGFEHLSRHSVEEKAAEEYLKLNHKFLKYDAESANEYFSKRPFEILQRQLELITPLTLFVGRIVLDLQFGNEFKNRKQRAKEFLEMISSFGPAFIKAGQALSSRPDLLPPEYLQELMKLQDQIPPFDNGTAFELIENELAPKYSMDSVFESIEDTPIAAASIGQVYKGVLKNGQVVAIKIQRPNCEQVIARDIYILRNASGILSNVLKLINQNLDLRLIIEEFGNLIYDEIDYVKESQNASRFAALFGDFPGVFVPRIYWQFTSSKLLVLEWVHGKRLTSESLPNRAALVQTLVECSLHQMLDENSGFYHCDPHGGNLLCMENGQICYLDFGMMSELNSEQRYGIIEAVIHLVNRDFDSLVKLYVRLGFLPKDTELQPIIDALADALPDVLTASVSELNFKSVIDKLGSVMYRFPFSLPPYYTAILRTLLVLEGLSIQIDPKFRIIEKAYPFIAGRLLVDNAPQLDDAMEYLLFNNGNARWDRLENLLESAADSNDYDISAAADRMTQFLLSERAANLRNTLTDDLVDQLDALSVDSVKYFNDLTLYRLDTLRKMLVSMERNPSEHGLLRLGNERVLMSVLNAVLRRYVKENSMDETVLKENKELVKYPEETKTMKMAMRLMDALGRSRGFDANKIGGIIGKLLQNEEGQRIVLEVGVNLSERLSSRLIRTLFQLPQNDTNLRRKN